MKTGRINCADKYREEATGKKVGHSETWFEREKDVAPEMENEPQTWRRAKDRLVDRKK